MEFNITVARARNVVPLPTAIEVKRKLANANKIDKIAPMSIKMVPLFFFFSTNTIQPMRKRSCPIIFKIPPKTK